jgi:hypothetical protein
MYRALASGSTVAARYRQAGQPSLDLPGLANDGIGQGR